MLLCSNVHRCYLSHVWTCAQLHPFSVTRFMKDKTRNQLDINMLQQEENNEYNVMTMFQQLLLSISIHFVSFRGLQTRHGRVRRQIYCNSATVQTRLKFLMVTMHSVNKRYPKLCLNYYNASSTRY